MKWIIYIDFPNLDTAFVNDSYPLLQIDQLINFIISHEPLSFLNAYSSNHQIFMANEDKEKKSFITDQRTYCYNVMPFELKKMHWQYSKE